MKKKILFLISLFLTPVLLYLLAALVLSNVFIGNNKPGNDSLYTVYVVSSDIHTEFIFPYKTPAFNWGSLFKIESKFISIGWGSREFFFEMQTWEDVKMKVILKAIFSPSESVMHVDFINALPVNQPLYALNLNHRDYLLLTQFIVEYFEFGIDGVQQIGEFSYYGTDRFFKSPRKYHMLKTCNMWTVDGLATIDWKRPLWSPFKYGIENALK